MCWDQYCVYLFFMKPALLYPVQIEIVSTVWGSQPRVLYVVVFNNSCQYSELCQVLLTILHRNLTYTVMGNTKFYHIPTMTSFMVVLYKQKPKKTTSTSLVNLILPFHFRRTFPSFRQLVGNYKTDLEGQQWGSDTTHTNR